MSLEPYTNTYTDTDGIIADSGDIVAEFDRIEAFIAAWAESYGGIGSTVRTIKIAGIDTYDLDPASGFVQSLIIDADVADININFKSREDGDPYRVYVILRFGSKDSRYTLSGPASRTTIFGINREEYLPSQVSKNGYFAGSIIATYGTDSLHLQVYADNVEDTTVESDDYLQGISV